MSLDFEWVYYSIFNVCNGVIDLWEGRIECRRHDTSLKPRV